MTNRIEGLVAKVLNVHELVINRGREHGVSRGTLFEILDMDNMTIVDPETGEELGAINRAKVRVKVTHIEDRLCIASTYRKVKRNEGGTGPDFAAAALSGLQPPKWVESVETLQVEEEVLIPRKSKVKIGDIARQIIDDAR